MTNVRPIVLGGGVAGMAAAAALRRTHDCVTILERDLEITSGTRRGVPQGRQLHNLLSRAQQHLDELLPGFIAELLARGGSVARVADQTHVYEFGFVMPARDLGLRLVSAPRPLIESVARACLDRIGGVEFVNDIHAESLLIAGDEVVGVRASVGTRDQTYSTGLVVDATGAGSPLARWLSDLGRDSPRVDVSHTARWYVTTTFTRPTKWRGDPTFWLVFPAADSTRGLLVSPLDDEHWSVSVSGIEGDPLPRNCDEVRHHVETIHDESARHILKGARAAGEPTIFRRARSSWRRFDLLENPLVGILPVGDSIAAMNPTFGQGLSLAAWEASELADVLDSSDTQSPAEMTREYLARSGRVAARGWCLNADVEALVPKDRHGRGGFRRLLSEDPTAHRDYVATWHLLEPVATLEQHLVAASLTGATQ